MDSTPTADPRLGQVVAGRYRILSRIGRGGMGAIYEAEHAVTGRRFAIKTLLPGLGGIDEIAKRFEREAHAASVLSHPNIVSVFDFGSLEDGSLYLVMELVAGRSLGEVMDQEPLSTRRALAIARQVLEALAHAHGAGVVHRDLKPDNIMLVDAGQSEEERDIAKLLDFGIAKLVGEAQVSATADKLTQSGVAFGTPDYMAPEQALGEEVDARADLYALGCIVYELIAGKPPFASDDKLAVLRMHVTVAPPALDAQLAPELRALVARALEKRRSDRFADAAEMLAALDVAIERQAALEPRADVSPSPSPSPSPSTLTSEPHGKAHPPPWRRGESVTPGRRLRRDLVIGLGVAAAVLLGVVLISGRRTPGAAGSMAGRLAPAADRSREAEAAGWRAAAFAYAAAGRDDEAVAAHLRALTAVPGRSDPLLFPWVDDLLTRKQVGAVELLPLMGGQGRAMLVEQASRGRTPALRARARDLAADNSVSGGVDLVGSFSLDLAQGASCRERREAIPRLRALRDKRAVPALKRARGRSGGFLGLSQVNSCLDKDAAEAIDFLQALP